MMEIGYPPDGGQTENITALLTLAIDETANQIGSPEFYQNMYSFFVEFTETCKGASNHMYCASVLSLIVNLVIMPFTNYAI